MSAAKIAASGEPAMTSAAMTCAWCGISFSLRRGGGKPQRFCSTGHRRRYDQAGRAWIRRAIEAGALTIADLQEAFETTRALRTAVPKQVRAAGGGGDG